MSAFGLVLLALVAGGLVTTGLPAFVVLLAVAVFGAAVAAIAGGVPIELLGAIPFRVVNLLESDLLQALPLYVLMGVMLDRLGVASALFRTAVALLPRGAGAALVAGLGLGVVTGPMNGSVGASVFSLARIVAPRLEARGIPAPTRHAVIAVAATFGVVVPPSLVLILLGDAMLSAHTIASNVAQRSARIINTQDVFHAALVPAAIFVALAMAIAWWVGGRGSTAAGTEPSTAASAEPSTAASAEPSTTAGTEPSTAASAEPSTAAGTQPSTAASAEPSMGASAEPSTAAGTEPTSRVTPGEVTLGAAGAESTSRITPGEVMLAIVAMALLAVLLGGVTAGYFYAVEAAAIGGFTLVVIGIVGGRLRRAALRETLATVMATTGALFALLVAATTLTLVLRMLGTDRLVADVIIALPGSERTVTAIVLAAVAATAFVLDAFEIIFVVVPIVIPPLLIRVADANWVAVLVLLTLQASFLLPPFGYALLMLRTALREAVPMRAVSVALLPFLIAQLAVFGAVLAAPKLVHLFDAPPAAASKALPSVSEEEIRRPMDEAVAPRVENAK